MQRKTTATVVEVGTGIFLCINFSAIPHSAEMDNTCEITSECFHDEQHRNTIGVRHCAGSV